MPCIILEFIGGSWDGMNLCTDSPDELETRLAVQTYLSTHGGRPGQKVCMLEDYGLKPRTAGGSHYVVTQHTAMGNDVLVRLETVAEGEPAEVHPPPEVEPAPKCFVIRFCGGPLNDRMLRSDSPEVSTALLAAAFYCVTDHGAPGAHTNALGALHRESQTSRTPDGLDGHYQYIVTQRKETAHEVHVTLQHAKSK